MKGLWWCRGENRILNHVGNIVIIILYNIFHKIVIHSSQVKPIDDYDIIIIRLKLDYVTHSDEELCSIKYIRQVKFGLR